MEAKLYYYGLPSRPTLVARTGTTPWKVPTDPEATLVAKELRPLGKHPLRSDTDNIFVKILALLDSLEVQWTSIDPLRIGEEGADYAPVVVWIGVRPGSLSREDGVVVVSTCKKLLEDHDLTDVEVEIRESDVWSGP